MAMILPMTKTHLVFQSLKIGPEKNFCYLLLCPRTLDAALFDPAFEAERVAKWCKKVALENGVENLNMKYLIATHGHRDHAGGFPEMLEIFPQAKVACHADDVYRLRAFGIKVNEPLVDGQSIHVGKIEVKAIHTPGHTEGGCCYHIEDFLLSGDTLFIDQCGRTDLLGASESELYFSLQKLKKLPPYTIIYPGHDYGPKPFATLKEQLATNPALLAHDFETFKNIP